MLEIAWENVVNMAPQFSVQTDLISPLVHAQQVLDWASVILNGKESQERKERKEKSRERREKSRERREEGEETKGAVFSSSRCINTSTAYSL